jgi:hypothetical protein
MNALKTFIQSLLKALISKFPLYFRHHLIEQWMKTVEVEG